MKIMLGAVRMQQLMFYKCLFLFQWSHFIRINMIVLCVAEKARWN